MSRSNPTTNTPNPATRFFEWNGEHGTYRYYDKETKQRVDVGTKFMFIMLDQLATVKGWHEASESSIYANEVRDTRTEPLTVKSFKGGPIASGLYANIKDTVAAHGGHFVANCYIAFKEGEGKDARLVMGSVQFKGAGLVAWFEFVKANRADVYEKAVMSDGFTEGKKGKVTYRIPKFRIIELGAENHDMATALDRELQAYLAGYFERAKISGVARDAVNGQYVEDAPTTDADASPFNDEGSEPPADYRTPMGPQGKKLLNQPGPHSKATVGRPEPHQQPAEEEEVIF